MDIEIIEAGIKFDRDEPETVLFGVIPEGYTGLTSELELDDEVFYWLTKNEAHSFDVGFTNGEWTVLELY
jgi:hypothetical protein